MVVNNREQGRIGEDLAVEFLTKKGYHILQRNFRFDRGEIDIVAQHGNELVFIEVKARRTATYGEPEDALTPAKCEQIRRVAEGYLLEHDIHDQSPRFDVVAIMFDAKVPVIRHLEDAF